jgi:hypothetical protein
MHDYLSKSKSFNFHYFVLYIGTGRGNPYLPVVAGEKLMLHHSFNLEVLNVPMRNGKGLTKQSMFIYTYGCSVLVNIL